MAIFATNANSNTSLIILSQNISENDVLVFDQTTGNFTNKKLTPAITGAVVSARNIGGTNAIGVFENKTPSGILQFNNLLEGAGIHLFKDNNNNIIISRDDSDLDVSVPEDYNIIIDNDGDNPNAVFEIKTVIPTSTIVIPINVLPPFTFNNLYTLVTSGKATIQDISNVDFSAIGYQSEMIISVEGTTDQDGYYSIEDVVTVSASGMFSSSIIMKEAFIGSALSTLGGPKPPITIKQGSIWVPDNDGSLSSAYSNTRLYSLQFWGVDLGTGGYNLQPDMIITITGTESGIVDGTYRIKEVIPGGNNPSVKWDSLIFDPSTPLPEFLEPGIVFDSNLFSNQIKITVNQFVAPTGFTVNALGEVTGTKFTCSALPITDSELANKFYVDDAIESEISAFNDNVVSALANQINNLNIQINNLNKRTSKALRYYLNHAKF